MKPNVMLKLLVAFAFSGVAVFAAAEPVGDKEEKSIRALVESLVFEHERATETPLISPGIAGDDDKEYERQFKKCQQAFEGLTAFKGKALPILVEHLEDKRPSIHFRNHHLGHSVGDACYWNIYLQLQDQPENYSEYGYQREGRDGKDHPKPYWEGTPFDEAGGLAEWLEANKKLSYAEMQIKCLTWLLDREKEIGASDPESYFVNILPLEIRILERKSELGVDVNEELKRLRGVLERKDADAVPRDLLPPETEQGGTGQPATAPESKPEGDGKPKPESEARPK